MARKYIDEDAVRAKNNARANRQGPLKKKASTFVYIIVLIVSVIARFVQLTTNYDYSRGRYINTNPLLNYTLLILLAGFAVIGFVLITGSARDKVIKSVVLINPWRLRYDRLSKKIPVAAGYAAIAMAILFVMDIIVYFVSLWAGNERYAKENLVYDAVKNPDVDKYAYKEYNRLTGYNVGTFFYQLLMILVILTFISIAVNIFRGVGLTHANCASLATYSVWQIVNILRMISQNDMIALSTDRLYVLHDHGEILQRHGEKGHTLLALLLGLHLIHTGSRERDTQIYPAHTSRRLPCFRVLRDKTGNGSSFHRRPRHHLHDRYRGLGILEHICLQTHAQAFDRQPPLDESSSCPLL